MAQSLTSAQAGSTASLTRMVGGLISAGLALAVGLGCSSKDEEEPDIERRGW